VIKLPIYRKGAVIAHAMVDDEDAELAICRWHMHRAGYPCRSRWVDGRTVHEALHAVVMGHAGVDHRDRNRLNAQRANLRPATQAQNLQNLTPRRSDLPRGVYRNHGRWKAQVRHKGKTYYLGNFGTVEEAAEAAAAWRREHFVFSEGDR
jgi:hypothetical protein